MERDKIELLTSKEREEEEEMKRELLGIWVLNILNFMSF